MDDRYLLVAARYVELNPVRARLVRSPWNYEWSSAGAHLRGEDDSLVKIASLLEMVDDWNEFLRQGLEDKDMELLRRHGRAGRPRRVIISRFAGGATGSGCGESP